MNAVTVIFAGLINAFGLIAGLLIHILVAVAKINNFINVPAVQFGWVIMRDLCNMFFILILLVIAFATILRIEGYQAKSLLPKLLIMAVLINFSKTIAGLIIDFAQIIMLTFVFSFDGVDKGNFAEMLGLPYILEFNKFDSFSDKEAKEQVAGGFSILTAYVLGLIYVIISIIVIAAILGVLIVRVVMIWIYVVLSPVAYLAAIIPQTRSIASRWWSEFLDYVFKGPILAFFIWLAFISMSGVAQPADMVDVLKIETKEGEKIQINKDAPSFLTEAGSPDHLIKFAISIGMLIAGLMMAQQAGGYMGKAAQKFSGAAKKGMLGGMAVGGDWLNRWQMNKMSLPFSKRPGTGIDLNLKRTMGTLKAGRQQAIDRELREGRNKAQENADKGGVLGLTTGVSAPGYFDRYMNMKGVGRVGKSIFAGKGVHVTEKGAMESLKKQREEIESRKNNIYSEEEYNSDLTRINTKRDEKLKESDTQADEARTEKGQLLAEKQKLENNVINNPQIPVGDKRREEAKAEIKNLDAKIAKSDAIISKADEKKENIRAKADKEEKAVEERRAKSENSKLWHSTKAKADVDRGKLDKEIGDIGDKITKSAYLDFEGQKARAAEVSEEMKNVSGINDEEELIVHFKNAVANDNSTRAEAILKKLASINGTNTLLGKYGRPADADNFSDFMKEIFEDKLKVSPQRTMQIQGDLDGIGLEKNCRHISKTVAIDETGKRRRLTGNDATEEDRNKSDDLYVSETQKLDSETIARKANRLAYGGEDLDGNFQWSDGGLKLFLNNLQGIAKEMKGGGRFNKNSAVQITNKGEGSSALRKLEAILEKNEDLMDLVRSGNSDYPTPQDFINAMKLRGRQSRPNVNLDEVNKA
ncbi:hypothetical protein GF382_02880 [Candidatus Falkowbacteria bacterium]|nr:hypothetical protein [Candidatus Falkowbacteria bacterium]